MPKRMTAPIVIDSGHPNMTILPIQPEVYHGDVASLAGVTIRTEGSQWHVGPDVRLSWKGWSSLPALAGFGVKRYLKHLIAHRSPEYVRNNFVWLKKLATPDVAAAVRTGLERDGTIGYEAFTAFEVEVAKVVAPSNVDNYRAAFRRWYGFAVDIQQPGFDPDVAADLDDLVLVGNPQGHAVLSSDPDEGPLCESDFLALLARLNDATADALEAVARKERPPLPLASIALLWMFVCYGTNPKNMRYLDEDDLSARKLGDGRTLHSIRIPRIKKRLSDTRLEFRTREVPPEVAKVLEALIVENRGHAPIENDEPGIARPMFRANSRPDLEGSRFEKDRHRLSKRDVGPIINDVVLSLNVPAIGGGALHVSPRRLRYTFTARLVANGATPAEVADALDHSSTGHVMVYFNARGELVRQLSKAVALALAPVVQAFLGMLVEPGDDIARGDDPTAAIHVHSPAMRKLERLGTCGKFGFCGEAAPIACYTCRKFQPFYEAPHHLVLEALEEKRDRRITEGAHPKMIQINDRAMFAVAQVMLRQEEWLARKEDNNG